MKRNNKGFMLVEVIVMSTIVVTTMVALYTSFNRLYNNYRTKTSYYDLDGVYATEELLNMMVKSTDNSFNINAFINNTFYSEHYGYLIHNGVCNYNVSLGCATLKNLYQVENMIFVEYNQSVLLSLKNVVSNQTFRDYIDYLITYYNMEGTLDDFNYIILTELKVGSDYSYANLRMR